MGQQEVHIKASVLCDTGASISLAPVSIARQMKIKVDKSRTRSVRGADCKRLNSIGMGFVYMKVPASPSWKRMEVVITKTGENFLLAHADLKNLDLISNDFPEYLGDRRREFTRKVQEEDEIVFRAQSPDEVNNVETDKEEILVSQGEFAVTLKLPEEISDEQVQEAEAYAALYALGGYTYNNVVHKVPDKQCNSAKND